MKAVVIRTNGIITVEKLREPLHEDTRRILGGLCEVVHARRLKDPYRMLVNESGLLLGLDKNRVGCYLYGTDIHGAPIVGNVIIMKEAVVNELGERDIVGLSDREARTVEKTMSMLQQMLLALAEAQEEDDGK